jgi:hypothetical protein
MENDNELKNIAQALIKAQIELANPEKNAKSNIVLTPTRSPSLYGICAIANP